MSTTPSIPPPEPPQPPRPRTYRKRPRPDPVSVDHATFRGTGRPPVVAAINALLAGGPVNEARLLAEVAPVVDPRDAGQAWIDYFHYRRWRGQTPDPDAPHSELVFRTGIGRPATETKTDRYDAGARLFIIQKVLGRLKGYEAITADGQPYGDRRGHRKGLAFWRLRPVPPQAARPERPPKPRPPKRRREPKQRPSTPDAGA